MISLLIVLIICLGKIEATNKLNQSDQLLNNYISTLPNPTNNSISPIKSLATPVTSLESSKISNSNDYPKSGEILGLIYIDKISLKLPIIEDSDDNNLWLGATHVKGTPLPWEKGNSFLASHNTNIYGKLFTRLNELTIGDKLTISTPKGNFAYVVYDTEIVPPDDSEPLSIKIESILRILGNEPRSVKPVHPRTAQAHYWSIL